MEVWKEVMPQSTFPPVFAARISMNTFLRLEVRCGKYPIIKYTEFLAALNKSSKWEVFVVPYNFGRLVLYEAKNAITVVVNEHFLGNAFGTLHIV